jgi:hypothetical protein
MNSTRSALPAFMSDCRIAVSLADASTATRWPRTPTTVTPARYGGVHLIMRPVPIELSFAIEAGRIETA